jgi:lipopolysaccharide biosynthesis regulator YciM
MTSTTNTVILIAAAVLVVAAVLVAALWRRRQPERPQDPYIEALTLLIDGDVARAFDRLQSVVKRGAAPVDAYIRLGELLRERGDASKALQIHKSLTVKSDLTRKEKVALFVNIAEDYAQLGRSDQAVTVLDTALNRMNLREESIYSILARESHNLGRVEDAYGYLRELKKLGTIGDREISLYLATVGADMAADERQNKDAKRTLHRALKHDAGCAPAHLALGDAEAKSGNYDEAIRHWRRAAVMSEELSRVALERLEKLMFERGTFNEIGKVYQEVLDARPEDERATMALASFFKKQGRVEDAISMLEDYQATRPHSVESTLLLTSMYAVARDSSDLERFLDENEELFTTNERYTCQVCGYESSTMRWHCSHCNGFDTYVAHGA